MSGKVFLAAAITLVSFAAAPVASAHEAYVLPLEEFRSGLAAPGFNVFDALKNPHNARLFWLIGGAALLAVAAVAALEYYRGRAIADFFERGRAYGKPLLRIAFGAAIFFSAWTNNFLGAELPLDSLGFAPVARAALFFAGVLLIAGIATELGAAIALIAFAAAVCHYGLYLLGYASYLAEIAALLCFGAGAFSMDAWLRRNSPRARFKEWEALLLRLGYGSALIFAAIKVKFLHPILTLNVVTEYQLTRFHLLFPRDPLLVVLGAALVELGISICILIGFETRFVILVSLFYMTLSLFFFGEAVWPHFILYGLSFYLLLTPQKFSLDGWLESRRHR